MQRTSPFEPPKESDATFVVDSDTGLDTGCTFRGGGPLEFAIAVDRVVGDKAKLLASGLIRATAKLNMPAFDVDYAADVSGIYPERDRVFFNGHVVQTEFLRGINDTWILNDFQIPIDWINFPSDPGEGRTPTPALNRIRIDIDTANTDGEYWCTSIDWAALTVEVARPVLTVHGIFSNAGTWTQSSFNWQRAIGDLGLPYASISMHEAGGIGLDPIEDNAIDIERKVDKLLSQWGVDKIAIVAHSKGGLDSRHYAETHNTIEQIIQLGTPNAGSPLADLAQAGAVVLIGPVNTALLDGLAAPAGVQLTTVYMGLYNLFHGRNPNTNYVSIAGDYRAGGFGIIDAKLAEVLGGPSDTVVPVWSVHSLGYAEHQVHRSTGTNISAWHTSLTNAEPLFDAAKPYLRRIAKPAMAAVAAATAAPVASLQSRSILAGVVAQGATTTQSINVDPVAELAFMLQYGSGRIDFELESPSGQRIDPAAAADDVNVEYEAVDNGSGAFMVAYSIRNPEAGAWTLRFYGREVVNSTGHEAYSVVAQMSGSSITFEAALDKGAYKVGDAIGVMAHLVSNGAPKTDAQVNAKIAQPDGSAVEIALADNGSGADLVAGDGKYSGVYPAALQNGVYSILVRASGDAPAAFQRDQLLMAPVALSQSVFGTSYGDFAEDVDGNGLYEDLVVQVGVDIKASAKYRLVGELYDKDGQPVASASSVGMLPLGPQAVVLSFDGNEIFKHAVDGPYTLKFVRVAEENGFALLPVTEIQDAHTTAAYRYLDFQGEAIVVTGTGSDRGIDADGDSFYDQLEVRMNVLVREAGGYDWSARLTDQDGSELGVVAGDSQFTQGINTITMLFDGSAIGRNRKDGPYQVNDVLILGSANSTVALQGYSTNMYKYNQFKEGAVSLPPHADAGGPYSVDERLPLVLTAAASTDPDGVLVSYRWDLDNDGLYDDATGITTTVTYFFSDEGTFPIGLEVTDNSGDRDHTDTAVTVVNGAPEVNVTPTQQTVLFGQGATDVSITAYDIAADPLAVANISWSQRGATPIPGLPKWLTLSKPQCGIEQGMTWCTWLLQGRGLPPAGTTTIEIVVADDDGGKLTIIVEYTAHSLYMPAIVRPK